MAKKKSGAQQRAWKRLKSKSGSLYSLLRSNKRGRPKGETEPIEERRGKIELDILFLFERGDLNTEERRWTDLMIANELLLDDQTRWEKYKLGKCQYRELPKGTLRRRVTALRNKFYGAKTQLRART
jgi:hypothetical protein